MMAVGTLRGWSVSSRHDEWEKMTGARVVSRASDIVSGETWERSTSMPRRFISATTPRPTSVRPPWTAASVAESAHDVVAPWVRVR